MRIGVFKGRVVELSVHERSSGALAEVGFLGEEGGNFNFLVTDEANLRVLSKCFLNGKVVQVELVSLSGIGELFVWASKVEEDGERGDFGSGKTMVMGIDPGVSGGVALLSDEVCLYKMPDTERGLWNLLKELAGGGGVFAFVEEVGALPARMRGTVASVKLGMSYGAVRMALAGLGVPFEVVRSSKWQKALDCLSKGDKRITKIKAQELFPQVKVTHWGADALLIAEYGRRSLFSCR